MKQNEIKLLDSEEGKKHQKYVLSKKQKKGKIMGLTVGGSMTALAELLYIPMILEQPDMTLYFTSLSLGFIISGGIFGFSYASDIKEKIRKMDKNPYRPILEGEVTTKQRDLVVINGMLKLLGYEPVIIDNKDIVINDKNNVSVGEIKRRIPFMKYRFSNVDQESNLLQIEIGENRFKKYYNISKTHPDNSKTELNISMEYPVNAKLSISETVGYQDQKSELAFSVDSAGNIEIKNNGQTLSYYTTSSQQETILNPAEEIITTALDYMETKTPGITDFISEFFYKNPYTKQDTKEKNSAKVLYLQPQTTRKAA